MDHFSTKNLSIYKKLFLKFNMEIYLKIITYKVFKYKIFENTNLIYIEYIVNYILHI